ncbi:MAG: HAMP domain-containing sensor histidine kinase [Nitrosarchaeum sp.]|jgi:signal transduction histidine kinase|uniref:sensor histidine kinase n=1 Tax=Nitrosarchaeum sp. TaxID=2026886 RepID=UPI002DE776F1|nr:HAMP domain-containing sensor histidine kinase [Nitrosarchaeum sp.]
MDNLEYKHNESKKDHNRIIFLVSVLLGITLLYQVRPFLEDSQFILISIPAYAIIVVILLLFSLLLTIKLYKQNHFQSKAFMLFTIGVSFWFVADQIWVIYENIYDVDPFPSIADVFYIGAYLFFVGFLLLSLKPIKKLITKKIWLFAFLLSLSLVIPSVMGYSNSFDKEGELDVFSKSILLSYPIMSGFQLAPAIVGILFMVKKGVSYSWMLMLFAFLIYSISDTFYLFSSLDNTYHDGHPVDLMYLYSYILLIFSVHNRIKISNNSNIRSNEIFFNEDIKFETITKYGIPLTLLIFSMIVVISMISILYLNPEEGFSFEHIVFGVSAILIVFSVIIITINRNLTKFVRMKTIDLEKQRSSLEELIEEKTQAVLKAERLSAIGELSGRLAHDLRNPLSVMKLSVDLIKQHPADTKISDTIITKRLELIEKSIDRISHQVDDVLDYVRNSPLKPTSVSLRTLILASIDKVHVPHDVIITVSDADVIVTCDTVKIDAVFINLIINAIQAMNQGGTLEINIKTHGDYAVIDFIDSGLGIPEDFINKIFEPLFTTKQKGTGLGLASCKNIIEQHNGSITVKNNPTTFTIKIPKTYDGLGRQ